MRRIFEISTNGFVHFSRGYDCFVLSTGSLFSVGRQQVSKITDAIHDVNDAGYAH